MAITIGWEPPQPKKGKITIGWEPPQQKTEQSEALGIERVAAGIISSAIGSITGPIAAAAKSMRQVPSPEEYEKYFGYNPLKEERYPGETAYYKKELEEGPAFEGLFKIPDLSPQDIREKYADVRGLQPESLEPQNILEKGINAISEYLPNIGFSAASAARSALPGLGREAAKTAIKSGLKTAAGIEVGSEIGRKTAQTAGFGELGEGIGSILGGLGGSLAAHRIGKPMFTKELFNKEKSARLKELQKTKDDLDKKISTLERSRKENYALAKKSARGIKEFAPDVRNLIEELKSSTKLGLEPDEQKKILGMLSQLEGQMKDGTLSLESAKIFKKNLNAAIYDRNLPKTVRGYYGDINRGINNWIAEVGEKYPVHGKPWELAETQHAELESLKKSFNEKQFKKQMNDIAKEKYDTFVERVSGYEKEAVSNAIDKSGISLTDVGLGALSYALGSGYAGAIGTALGARKIGKEALKQYTIIKEVLKNNPEIAEELKTALKAAAQKNIPLFAQSITKFDRDINKQMQ